jgi:uncharacterized lipoprotein NlpE involved in copper resistance
MKYFTIIFASLVFALTGCDNNSTAPKPASSEVLAMLINSETVPNFVPKATVGFGYWQTICENKAQDKTWPSAVTYCAGRTGPQCVIVVKMNESKICSV